VEVRDDDARALEVVEHVARHELAARVVGVGVIGLQHSQAVANREPGRDHEEALREPLAVPVPHGVHRLPRDEHRHDRRLARARRKFQREPRQAGVRLCVRGVEVGEEASPLPRVGRDLGEPDGSFDGLDLAEEGPDTHELVLPPVLEEAGSLGRHAPLARIRQRPPAVHEHAEVADDRRGVVLLRRSRQPFALVGDHLELLARAPALARLRDRGDELGPAPALDDGIGRLPAFVELPVPPRVLVRGVEDRSFEERLDHVLLTGALPR